MKIDVREIEPAMHHCEIGKELNTGLLELIVLENPRPP